jgi:hypothetical protein
MLYEPKALIEMAFLKLKDLHDIKTFFMILHHGVTGITSLEFKKALILFFSIRNLSPQRTIHCRKHIA